MTLPAVITRTVGRDPAIVVAAPHGDGIGSSAPCASPGRLAHGFVDALARDGPGGPAPSPHRPASGSSCSASELMQ